MPDDIIERLAVCGERPRTYPDLRRHIHWAFIHDTKSKGPNSWGVRFLLLLEEIYNLWDAEDQRLVGCGGSEAGRKETA